MKHWHLPDIGPSTRKRVERAPGADAPREKDPERTIPRVLFAHPECRGIIVDLAAGEEMGDHQVKERAVVQLLTGRATFRVADGEVEGSAGALVVFDPSEPHSVLAHEPSRLLLVLATTGQERPAHDGTRLPRNATAPPHEVVD